MAHSLENPWTSAHWAPLSMGLPRQENQSRLPGIQPRDPARWLLHRQAESLPLNHLGALLFLLVLLKFSEVYSNHLWVLWKAGSDSGCLGWDFIFYASNKISQFSCSVMLFATPWNAACPASLSITNSQSLLKLMSIQSVMSSNHLICSPLLLLLTRYQANITDSPSILQVAKTLITFLGHWWFTLSACLV